MDFVKGSASIGVLIVLGFGFSEITSGCSSDSNSSNNSATGGTSGTTATGGSSGTNNPLPDGGDREWCSGVAEQSMIDDMHGPEISLPSPPCATSGSWGLAWYPSISEGTLITNPVLPGDTPSKSLATHCGNFCEDLFSPLPAGFPGVTPTADGGAGGGQALCIAGRTRDQLYDYAGMFLQFAYAGDMPDGGPVVTPGSYVGSVSTLAPPPALIDASAYAGVQFWLWVSADTLAPVSKSFEVYLQDKYELPGFGICHDSSPYGDGCGPAWATASRDDDRATGPMLDSSGAPLASLSAGWQMIKIPWSSFVTQPWWGGTNEKAVDPRFLTSVTFLVEQRTAPDAGGVAIPFDYCIYQLSFYN